MKVLIVDDSVVYRTKIKAALAGESWIEVVGVASNGKIALEMLTQKSIDLITLDMEMPTMDGLRTLKELRQRDRATKVIVFSSSTVRGSEATLDALRSGADDFVTKPVADAALGLAPEEIIRRDLIPKIRQFLKDGPRPEPSTSVPGPATKKSAEFLSKDLDTFRPSAIVIASSTGGPAAHEVVFNDLRGKLKCPIFIAQHMPPVFTTAFAKRIGDASGLPCREAVNGEAVRNEIYVAPGDFHLTLKKDGERVVMALDKGPQRNSVRPAADPLFETASAIYGAKCMGIVLTGMGEDGLVGSRAVKTAGGGVMIQNKESCVVFGMPAAVQAAGIQDDIGSLEKIRTMIARMALL